MLAIIPGFAVGVLQVIALKMLLGATLKGKMSKMIVPLLVKFGVYGIGFALLYFSFRDSVVYAAIGFTVGVIASVIAVYIKSRGEKTSNNSEGDDAREHGGAD